MPKMMSRRQFVWQASIGPMVAVACASGCGPGTANQRTSGTLVEPVDAVERADEIAAKKQEALLKTRGKGTGKK